MTNAARYLPLLLLLPLAACAPAADGPDATTQDATAPPPPAITAADSSAARATAHRFREALVGGDSLAVANLLTAEAVILEGGRRETRQEYLSHHFHADAAFLGAVAREPDTETWHLAGPAAWVASTSRLHGRYRDRDVDVRSAELLVLQKTAQGWGVAAVHWSSR